MRRGVALAALAIVCAAGAASAQSIDRRTFFQFSGPVAVPGVTLPAGKYVFHVAGTTQREVLQVLSADGRTSYAQFLAWRAERRESVPAPELRFMETGPGVAPAIKTWWHPSELVGYEVIYPRAQARLLAKAIGQPVLTTREEAIAGPPVELTLVGPTDEEQPVAQPVPFVADLPFVIGEPAPDLMPLARAELPRTAGREAVVLAAGLLLLFGAALLSGVRVVRR